LQALLQDGLLLRARGFETFRYRAEVSLVEQKTNHVFFNEPSSNRKPTMCFSMSSTLPVSAVFRPFSLMIMVSLSSHCFQPSADTFS
jgi:hypothetical protein